jgi:hypothetical protein
MHVQCAVCGMWTRSARSGKNYKLQITTVPRTGVLQYKYWYRRHRLIRLETLVFVLVDWYSTPSTRYQYCRTDSAWSLEHMRTSCTAYSTWHFCFLQQKTAIHFSRLNCQHLNNRTTTELGATSGVKRDTHHTYHIFFVLLLYSDYSYYFCTVYIVAYM